MFFLLTLINISKVECILFVQLTPSSLIPTPIYYYHLIWYVSFHIKPVRYLDPSFSLLVESCVKLDFICYIIFMYIYRILLMVDIYALYIFCVFDYKCNLSAYSPTHNLQAYIKNFLSFFILYFFSLFFNILNINLFLCF